MAFIRRFVDSFKPMEDGKSVNMGEEDEKLKRDLSSRHLQMIAIGGSIGTGLFVASGITCFISISNVVSLDNF
jgi:amino acid permease